MTRNRTITMRVLCPATVVALLLVVCAPASASILVGHWTLDDPVGTDPIADATGNHPAAELGSPVLGIPGKVGTAASFPSSAGVGTGSFLTSTSTALNVGSFTASFWFNPLLSEGGAHNAMLSNRVSPEGFIFYQYLDTVQFWLQNADENSWQSQSVGITRGEDVWYHIAGVYDASTGIKEFYVTPETATNATVDATQTGATHSDINPIPAIGIGSLARSAKHVPLNGGYLDDIQLYNRALTAEQIDLLFQNPGVTVVPEPASAVLCLISLFGLTGLLMLRRAQAARS